MAPGPRTVETAPPASRHAAAASRVRPLTARALAAASGALGVALLAACATGTTVVLLPEASGRDTALTVTHDGRSVVLDRPYAAARQGVFGLQPYASSAAEVEAAFGPALAAQPARAARFTLYFVEGKDVLTDESRQLVETSLAEIARRPVPDVLVVGHTDLVGGHPQNDALSRQRAELIRGELVRLGIAADSIAVVARGKRDPVVPTADGVAEPRNRRVEVVVR